MNTQEVTSKLVALCREQQLLVAINSLDADDFRSVEAQEIGEMPAEMRGLDQVHVREERLKESNG